MTGGRYRTTIPEPPEMIELGKEMVEWVSDKKNNCLHVSQWWRIHKNIVANVWENMCATKEFYPYYEQAINIVGIQYLDKNSRVRDGISQRWQRAYFKDLKHVEDEDAKFNASLNKVPDNIPPPNQDYITTNHENMKLKAEIAELKAKLSLGDNADKS